MNQNGKIMKQFTSLYLYSSSLSLIQSSLSSYRNYKPSTMKLSEDCSKRLISWVPLTDAFNPSKLKLMNTKVTLTA